MRDNANSINPSMARGSIDLVKGNLLHGWLYGQSRNIHPLVMVNGSGASLIETDLARPDVCAALGIGESERPGFIFQLPAASAGVRIDLYAVGSDRCFLVASETLEMPIAETSLIAQVDRAAKVARQPGAIGIVSSEGGHSSIARAFELYQIAATRYPAILLSYLNEEYGNKLWRPLQNWDGNIITIPWSRRETGEALLKAYGINFDTVWISNSTLPSFVLAGAISRPGTRYVLDIDDNGNPDCRFAGSGRSGKYPGANLAMHLAERIRARTVSSAALQSRFGGHIVRHARQRIPAISSSGDARIHIGFIGPIHSHKNILALARSIRMLASATGLPLVLDIYADASPDGNEEELREVGAFLHGPLAFSETGRALAGMHVIVAGFSGTPDIYDGESANDYHVPSIISDALAAGKPVLVPGTQAVRDLADIPGIWLFTHNDFSRKLFVALSDKTHVYMPDEFTPEGAYSSFAAARDEAQRDILMPGVAPADDCEAQPAIVLIWKQCDAGIYGRRPDQIARSLTKAFPDVRIVIMEISGDFHDEGPGQIYFPHSDDFCSDVQLQRRSLLQKRTGVARDGITYQAFVCASASALNDEFESYLIKNRILPKNSLFILFPFIEKLETIQDILRPYPLLADIVDNNLSWSKEYAAPEQIVAQYFSLMASAKHVIFNSAANREFFLERGFVSHEETTLIPNWYCLPEGVALERRPIQDGKKHVFYSGNLNDRIDWRIMNLAAALPGIQLHIAGNADQRKNELASLLESESVYHGPLEERQTLEWLVQMDACIVPHKLDRFSFYMNPMKLEMYRALGIPAILPEWLAGGSSENSYCSAEEFAALMMNLPKRTEPAKQGQSASVSCDAYLDMVRRYHPCQAVRSAGGRHS